MTPEQRAKNLEQARKWHKDNPEKARAKSRNWRKNNIDKSYPSAKWSTMTPEQKAKRTESARKWRKKNTEHTMFLQVRSRARIDGIPFNLELSDFVIPDYCPVLGIKLEKGVGLRADNSPSIDKIIPALGYTKGNIIIVSWKANRIKTNATVDEILKVGLFYESLIQEQRSAA